MLAFPWFLHDMFFFRVLCHLLTNMNSRWQNHAPAT